MKLICKYNMEKCTNIRPPQFLVNFFNLLIKWHGEESILLVRELISQPHCPQQIQHSDCELYPITRKRRPFLDIPFSLIAALEENANQTYIINHNRQSVHLKQGEFAMWRGDYEHAGAAYAQLNRRLFVAIVKEAEMKRFNFVTF